MSDKEHLIREQIHLVPITETQPVQKLAGLCPTCGIRIETSDPKIMTEWFEGRHWKLECPRCKPRLVAQLKHKPNTNIQPAAGLPDNVTKALLNKLKPQGRA